MNESVKAMPLFFIDNQKSWPKSAQLLSDLVFWPDDGIYPSYTPIASARLPGFDGLVIAQAGNLGLVVTFLPGVGKDGKAIQAAMSNKKERPEQYRIAVDSIIQRLALMRVNQDAGVQQDSVHPFSLLSWLAKSHSKEGAILVDALTAYMKAPESPQACDMAEDMRHTLQQGLAEGAKQAKA